MRSISYHYELYIDGEASRLIETSMPLDAICVGNYPQWQDSADGLNLAQTLCIESIESLVFLNEASDPIGQRVLVFCRRASRDFAK